MVDKLLGGLFGASQNDDEPAQRQRANDFIDRHQRGAYDQIGDDEALHNYRATTSQLSPDQYQQAATDAFRQMTPEQRRELRHEMKRRSKDRFNPADDSPEEMARTMHQAHQEDSGGGGIAGLFGFGGNDADKNQKSQPQGGGIGGLFDNPLAKVALAGVAAMAAKKLTDPNR